LPQQGLLTTVSGEGSGTAGCDERGGAELSDAAAVVGAKRAAAAISVLPARFLWERRSRGRGGDAGCLRFARGAPDGRRCGGGASARVRPWRLWGARERRMGSDFEGGAGGTRVRLAPGAGKRAEEGWPGAACIELVRLEFLGRYRAKEGDDASFTKRSLDVLSSSRFSPFQY